MQGDVTDAASLEAAFARVDGLFHLAAVYAFGVDGDRMRIVNAIVSTVYGPGDPSAIGELVCLFAAGRIPFMLDPAAGYTLAYVEDVAAGPRLAYERGRLGESYPISGTPVSFAELFQRLAALKGKPAPRYAVPPRLRPLLAPVVIAFGLILGKRPAQTRELLAMATGVTDCFCGEKARRELGWWPRTLDGGLRETVRCFLEGTQGTTEAAARRKAVGAGKASTPRFPRRQDSKDDVLLLQSSLRADAAVEGPRRRPAPGTINFRLGVQCFFHAASQSTQVGLAYAGEIAFVSAGGFYNLAGRTSAVAGVPSTSIGPGPSWARRSAPRLPCMVPAWLTCGMHKTMLVAWQWSRSATCRRSCIASSRPARRWRGCPCPSTS